VGGATGGVHGFSPALASFIGRADAVAEVAGLLAGSRLVTVAGPGGVGKTRLAGEVARQVADRFADGVWLVELAPVQAPALVGAAVAEALGIPLVAGRPVAESLAGVLSRWQVLVVLDNCEHVLDAAAVLCAELLPAADDMRVLATSREPLGLAGEARYRLPPLGLPGLDPARANGSEAVALFADRARQVVPGFTLNPEAGPVVAQVVARLDGMPLAIELAAARVEALGVAQLLERLDDRFGLLAGGDRTAPARQRSLAATVDWSYQLLDPPGQRMFRWLAVFPAPFTLDAAEAVAGGGAADVVVHLVECSLLVPPCTGLDGRARYVMLQTLRAFGRDRLTDSGEEPEAAAALAGYALAVAGRAAEGLQTSSGELAAGQWLDAEDATVHQAFTWALDHDPDVALRLALALAPWWWLRQRWAAGAADLLRAAAAHSVPGEGSWCTVQVWLGRAAISTGDMTGGLGHFTAARDALAPGGPSRALADALNGRAGSLAYLGRVSEGAKDARHALDVARQARYLTGEASALNSLAANARYAGDYSEALEWAQRACRIDPARIPGRVARMSRINLAMALAEAGDVPAAQRQGIDGLAAARQAGDHTGLVYCLNLVSELDLREGDTTEAAAHLQELIELSSRTGDRLILGDCLDRCGHLCAATRRWAEAVTMWAAFSAAVETDGTIDLAQDIRARKEPMRQAARALTSGLLRAARERGTAMTLATAVEFAALLAAQTVPQPPPSSQAVPASPPVAEPGVPPALAQLSPRERELVTLVARGRTWP
jgi:predicted ATPase